MCIALKILLMYMNGSNFVVPDIDIIESEIDSLLYSNTRMRTIGYPIYKEIMNIMIYLSNGNIVPEGMILSIYVGNHRQ